MAKFKIGDRVRTHHSHSDYNNKEGTITRPWNGGVTAWYIRTTPVPGYPDGEIPYSEDYLELLAPLDPFQQKVHDYILKELSNG